jgi:tetratricopeptide (TPR) repeat protein
VTSISGMASNDADAVLHVAEIYFTTGKYGRAEDVVGVALATDPHHPRLLTAYARAKLGQSDYAAAANSAHAALSVAPEDEHAMRVYSRALELQGRMPEAIWMAWRTATTHPHSHLAHHNYARLLEATGRLSDAMTVVNEALRLHPFDADALNLRGDIYLALGQVASAEADYREALRLNPEDAEAVHNLARLKYVRGRWWSAIHGFLGAGRLDPTYGDVARRNVGVALTGVLRRCTWLVLIVGFAVIVTFAQHEEGGATVIPRINRGRGCCAAAGDVHAGDARAAAPDAQIRSAATANARDPDHAAIRGSGFRRGDSDPRRDDVAGGAVLVTRSLTAGCRHRRSSH